MDKNAYFASQTADALERERLTALETVLDPRSTRQLAALGVSSGWSCLDVGAGGGSLTRWLAERVGPTGRVVAVDLDPRFLMSLDLPHVEVRRLDVTRDSLEESRFDLVHCRFLLAHLPEPLAVINRLKSALKVGGWLMIEEPDFRTYAAVDETHPQSVAFTSVVQSVFQRIAEVGLFDPWLGRQARTLLEQAGLSEIGHEGTVQVWQGGEAEAREHELSLPALVRAGVCTAAEAESIAQTLCDPTFRFVGHTVYAAWGRRGA
ncbi:MAG: class I SAM-dependent methyltransferase [Planctomycetes bacterium]|nr:class I SAM-dependent methyltransferase [Planctomycetota bacterium]